MLQFAYGVQASGAFHKGGFIFFRLMIKGALPLMVNRFFPPQAIPLAQP
jgi:hypothetical protein